MLDWQRVLKAKVVSRGQHCLHMSAIHGHKHTIHKTVNSTIKPLVWQWQEVLDYVSREVSPGSWRKSTIWGEVKSLSRGTQGTQWLLVCILQTSLSNEEPGLNNTHSASPFLLHKTSIMPSLGDGKHSVMLIEQGYRHRSQRKELFLGRTLGSNKRSTENLQPASAL